MLSRENFYFSYSNRGIEYGIEGKYISCMSWNIQYFTMRKSLCFMASRFFAVLRQMSLEKMPARKRSV